MLTLTELDDGRRRLIAREHTVAHAKLTWLPTAHADAHHCHDALAGLLPEGFSGLVARASGRWLNAFFLGAVELESQTVFRGLPGTTNCCLVLVS